MPKDLRAPVLRPLGPYGIAYTGKKWKGEYFHKRKNHSVLEIGWLLKCFRSANHPKGILIKQQMQKEHHAIKITLFGKQHFKGSFAVMLEA